VSITTIQRYDMLAATLDLLVVGVILVDDDCRIFYANRAGAQHLQEAKAVFRAGGRLTARSPAAASALRDAVARAVDGRDVAETGIAVPIPAADGRDLAAWAMRLHGGLYREFSAFSATAAVFLRVIGDAAPLAADLLMRRHRLTPAECRVLTMLTRGLSPYKAARALGCAPTTVRTHLRSIFNKTGARGQSELMRLAMSALAPASTALLSEGEPPDDAPRRKEPATAGVSE
jgi:DNA-binding CsgD family transcriptional regulator